MVSRESSYLASAMIIAGFAATMYSCRNTIFEDTTAACEAARAAYHQARDQAVRAVMDVPLQWPERYSLGVKLERVIEKHDVRSQRIAQDPAYACSSNDRFVFRLAIDKLEYIHERAAESNSAVEGEHSPMSQHSNTL